MTILKRRTLLIAGGASFAAAGAALAGGAGLLDRLAGMDDLPAAPVFEVGGVAIRGADPVAYFREGRAVAGDAGFEAEWNGVRWRFANAENLDAFVAEPARFAPQYGGFCAWAVAAKGDLFSTQPENWTIVDGKLYLNYNDAIQRKWEADIPGFIARANTRWPEIVSGLA